MRNKGIKTLLIFIFVLLLICGCSNSANHSSGNEVTSESVVLEKLPAFNNTQVEGILVKVLINKNNVIYGFEVSGHSGYADKGSDIVCSGVSTIAQNTLTSIKLYTKDKVEEEIRDDGYLKCILPNMKNNSGSNEACVLLKSAIVGFYSIESSYGSEYVSVYKVVD